jgi:DNA-binding NtrC family response regulator
MPAPVIVVHPDLNTRNLALSTLRAAGLEVVGFDDPTAMLDIVETDGRARVLVTSVNFAPGKLNGVALVRMLKYKRQGMKAVFLATPEDADDVDTEGVILQQPLDAAALTDTVARLLMELD